MTSPIPVTNFLAPLATPLPAIDRDDPFTEAQWTTLMSIMDSVIQSVTDDAARMDERSHMVVETKEYSETVKHIKDQVVGNLSEENLRAYFQEKASDVPEFQELMKRTFSCNVPQKGQKGLGVVLSALK